MANATYLLEMTIGAKTDPSFQRTIAGATYGINNIANFTSKATKAITAGLAAAGGAAVAFIANAQQTYKEFESAMANTAAIANATAQQEAAMEEAARYAGRTTTMTATQSAQALGYMALAGWSVSDSTRALLPVLRLAEATQADLQTTSDLVTDSMGALGLSVSDLDVYMDKLVATNNNANTTAEMLMEALIKTGGASQALGASVDDTITALGVLASAGFKAEEAGTAMNSILTRIAANTEAQKGLDALGVSIFDDNGKFIGLRETLIQVNHAMEGLSDEEKMASLRLVAGTRRVSQFQYLLNSVGETAEGVTSQWDTLEDHVVNSTGALDVMNERATDTMAAVQERLVSAWNDLKIGFTSTYADYWKDLLDDLATRLPELTDRIEEFGRTHREEIRALIKGISNFLANGANKLFDLIAFIVDNKEGVASTIFGVLAALKSTNFLTKLLQIKANLSLVGPQVGGLIKSFGTWGLVIGGVVAGVGLIASGIAKAKHEAIKANLAEHFGDVELSMKEVEELSKRLVYGDEYGLFKAFGRAADDLDRLQSSFDGALERLDKYDWQIKIGLGLDEDDVEDYKRAIDEFVDGAQDYLNQQHYQLTLAYDLLFGEAADEALGSVDSFYSSQLQELTDLGNQLRDAVNAGFEDGLLSIDEEAKIRELQKQIESIQKNLADAEYQAKLDMLADKYGGTNLTAESYKLLTEGVGEALQDKLAYYEEAKIAAYKELESERSAGKIGDLEYETRKNSIRNNYLNATAQATADNTAWLIDQMYGAYEGDIGSYSSINAAYNELVNDWGTGRVGSWAEAFDQNIEAIPYVADKTTRDAIKDLLDASKEAREAAIDTYEEIVRSGAAVPEALAEELNKYDILEAIVNGEQSDGEHVWNVVARKILNDPEYTEVLRSTLEAGEEAGQKIPEGLIKAIQANTGQVVGAANTQLEAVVNAIESRSINLTVPINLSTPVHYVRNSLGEERAVYEGGGTTTGYRYAGSVLSNAAGGIYNHEILTTAAEDGPEAIIPLDSSSRAKTLWAEAGRRMGLLGGRDSLLADSMDKGSSGSVYQVTFSPNITINGNASRQEVEAGVRDAYPEFERMMARYQREQQRVSFA